MFSFCSCLTEPGEAKVFVETHLRKRCMVVRRCVCPNLLLRTLGRKETVMLAPVSAVWLHLLRAQVEDLFDLAEMRKTAAEVPRGWTSRACGRLTDT